MNCFVFELRQGGVNLKDSWCTKNEVLTALIHLGYLGYDAERNKAYIPNYEVATAFQSALETGKWTDISSF